jgi:RHS repeat-associated protein
MTCLSQLDADNGQLEVHVSLVRYTPIGIGTSHPKKMVGGIRLLNSSLTSSPNPYNNTRYTYEKFNQAGVSSGSLPHNFITKFDITGQTINGTAFVGGLYYSGPFSPMALSPIQYVEVKEEKNHGQSTHYYFTGYEDGIYDDYGDFYATSGGVGGVGDPSLFGTADSFDFLRGNAKKTEYYNGSAITEKDTNTYQSKDVLLSEGLHYKAWAYYPEILFVESGGGYSSTPYTHFLFKRYNVSSTFPRQLAQEKTTYSPTGSSPIKQKQEFLFEAPVHLQRTGVRSYESDGSYHEIQTKYPLDYLGVLGLHSSIQAMIDSNYVSYPLEIKDTYYKNGVGTLVDAGVNTYQLVSGTGSRPQMILPYKTFGFNQYGNAIGFTTYLGASNEINSSSYREILHYVLFDNRGNIEHLKYKQSTDYAYLWGYQNQNALAVVQNATPTLVNTALSSIGSSRAALQSLTSPSSLQSTLTSLQSSSTLASAQMAFYTYHPIFGQISQTSSNGLNTYYAYDGFGRLEQVRDHENNLRKQIGYYYEADSVQRAIVGLSPLNVIYQSSFRVAGASSSDVSDETKASTEVSYFDQVGNLEQRLGYRNSPLKKDIAFEKVYLDSLSRVIKTVLPVPLSTNTGANEISVNYYADGFYSDNATNEVLSFDNSKLSRPLVQVGAGAAWRSPTLKATNFAYESAGADIPVYEVNGASGLTKTGVYSANSLYKNKVTDPQGNTQTEIKDLQGRVIEKIGALGDTTHYVYDISHNLRAVIQPEAMKNASFTASDLEKGVFYTNYDTKNRPKEKYVPSGGWTRYIYDKLDRVVLEQHAEQALQNKWSFTKYDVLGRVIQRGELVNSGTQSSLQSAFDGVNTPYEIWQGTAYSSQSFPITYNAVDVKNELYYDQYAWVNSALAFNASLAYHSQYSNAKGLATGSYARSPENVNQVFHTVLYYDNKGQVIQSQQTHHKGGSNLFTKPIITNFQYSFVGEVLAAKITYQVDGQSTISTLTTNEYDHAGRLLKVYHGINGIAPVEILRMTYDEIGRLSQKKILPNGSYYVGGTLDYINRPPSPNANIDDVAKKAVCLLPGTLINSSSVGHYSASINPNATTGMPISGLQTMDYQWHIRGGLHGINLDASGAVMPDSLQGDLFSFKLDYETGTPAAAGYYDGNIGKQTWRNVENNTKTGLRAYTYGYDAGSRLTAADYLGVSNENFSLPSINYDKNGNITKLRRYGKNGSAYGAIDSLNYTYTGNRLLNVADVISGNEDVGDFRDVNNGSADYSYYADGSLKSDANKGISLITYDTFLKKVKQVDFSNGNYVKWFYDGSGTLYKRTNSLGDVWEYLPSGLIFKNGVPYSLNIPDGRAVYVAGQWIYEFEYRDHQNNLRVAFKADGNQLVQTQTNETDPWGMVLKPLSTLAGSNPQKFDFVNRERADDFGLNIMHLGARMYDPVVPRFWQTEPLTEGQENWSVYQYGYNNPIRFNDANGLSSEECCQDAVDFMAGMVLTIVDNNSPIPTNLAGSENRGSYYEAGRKAGNYISLATGGAQIILGAGGNTAAGAGTLVTAGAGAPVTVPLSMGSTATMANGAATMAKAWNNLNSEGQKSQDKNKTSNPKKEAREQGRQARENQPAPEKRAKDSGRDLEKREGKDARRKAHDEKKKGEPDRTKKQLKEDYNTKW